MPSLNVKAMAAMLRLPVYEQVRILNEQKYPKQEPQIFRTPYYHPALAGITNYYRSGNSNAALVTARSKIESISQATRRLNNSRVLERFEQSPISTRHLTPQTNARLIASIGEVQLRLSLDLRATENEISRAIYFNCRNVKLDDEIARLTIEIAHWVFEQNQKEIKPECIEFIDLFSGRVHRIKKRRPTTITLLKNNAKIIETLWPTL